MEHRPRIYYSDAKKALMWERWRRGESLHKIATLFDRHHSSVRAVLSESGGIQPVPRRRSERVLSLAEREEISRVAVGKRMRAIGRSLGRAPSTIIRELHRNDGVDGYRANLADQRAWQRARRPKLCKLGLHRVLAMRVAAKLKQQWSPHQVSGWLKRTNPEDTSRQVSHDQSTERSTSHPEEP